MNAPSVGFVTAKEIDIQMLNWEKMQRFSGTIYAKNERLKELTNFVLLILRQPEKVFEISMHKDKQLLSLCFLFELIRSL